MLAVLALASGGCASWRQRDVAVQEAAVPATPLADGSGDKSQPLYDSKGDPVSRQAEWEDGDRETWWERFVASIPSAQEFNYGLRRIVGLGPDEAIAEQAFREGERLFARGNYLAAARKYKKAAFRWPDSPLEEDALFMQAESYFFADRYARADDTYGNLFEKYDNTRHLERAVARQFAIAQYWEQSYNARPTWAIAPNLVDRTRPWFDTLGNARKAYESVHMHDPTGPLADDAVMSLANSYFVRSQFDDADDYYTVLRTDYPKSPFQVKAHLLGLQAKLGSYQGAEYGGQPLVEAEELADQILAQFSSQLGDDRQRVLNTREHIKEQLAQRDYAMAQYYERTGYNRAARFYYGAILDDHPGTKTADLSEIRLAALQGVPEKTSMLDRIGKVVEIATNRVEQASYTAPLAPAAADPPSVATEPADGANRR